MEAGSQSAATHGNREQVDLPATAQKALEEHQTRKERDPEVTLKEFSKKYDVPYSVVYESSYRVHVESTMRRDREFPERELFAEVRRLLINRIEKHRAIVGKQEEILNRLRGVHP